MNNVKLFVSALMVFVALFLGVSYASNSFDDLFQDIEIQEEGETDEQVDDEKSDMHGSAEDSMNDIPKADISTYKHEWDKFLTINWDIDKAKYDPIVMINKDWSTYYSESLGKDILLKNPWHYLVDLQVQKNWQYVSTQQETVENSSELHKNIWEPDTWASLYILILIVFLITSVVYILKYYIPQNAK